MAELQRIKAYADEGLSVRRTAVVINRSPSSLASFARRHKIKFKAPPGYQPFQTREGRLALKRETQKRYRERYPDTVKATLRNHRTRKRAIRMAVANDRNGSAD